MIAPGRTEVTDLTVMVSGQGGDGSLTIVTLLGGLLAARGFNLYQSRDVRSRIKGGTAAAYLRASYGRRGCIADRIDLAIVFDAEALAAVAPRLHDGSVVVFDASWGEPDGNVLPSGVDVIPVPFGRLAVRELRRDLFKNSFAYGLATRVLSIPDGEAERALEHRFRHLRGPAAAANLAAARRGFAFAAEHGLTDGDGAWSLAAPERADRLLLTGNEAVALGFVVAGGRFFAGYPITPATEILQWLERRLPSLDGVVVQAEDELAAVNMALGAALTGVRAMTATSGPGIALMQEAVGHAGSAEIPLVVVDCQRAGPSTGMPTKPEQSDLQMLALGGNGDFPRVVLAPSSPDTAFTLTVAAVNLSQELQVPVYLALDQAVAQDAATIDGLDLAAVGVVRPKRHASGGAYQRYLVTDDGVSPWLPPGDPDGFALVTGNEHDPWGQVSVDPANRRTMIEKRARKLDLIIDRLPTGEHLGDPDAAVGVLGVGMEGGVIAEAIEVLAGDGVAVRGLVPHTVWPPTDDTRHFVAECGHVYVVEHNAGGQLGGLLRHAGVAGDRLRSIVRYDGVPFGPVELAGRIREAEVGR